MNAYLFVFDRNISRDYTKLLDGIKKDPKIKNWSHYMLSSYILISPYTASQLTDSIRTYFPHHRFIIMQVYSHNYSGWMPQDTWDWIKKNLDKS